MTKLLLPVLIFLLCQSTLGQEVYEPLVIIKENLLTRNYQAKDEYCLYQVQPKFLIENYEFRSSLIKGQKINSIKASEGNSSSFYSFNLNGHLASTVSYENDSIVKSIEYQNEYNKVGHLIKSPRKTGTRGKQERYLYDSKGQLIKYTNKYKRGFLKRSNKSEKIYKYDDSGNLIEIEGIKKFTYDEDGRLKLIEEVNVYGERFSKTNTKNQEKRIYGNRQFKEFFYNSTGLLERIDINHYDSLTYRNYHIKFEYNDSKKLTRITKFHASGKKWKVNELAYSGEFLTSNIETMYSGTSDSFSTSELKYFYQDGLIVKIEKYWSNHRVKRKLTDEIYYEYNFY